MPELRLLPGLPEVMKTFLLTLAALLLSSQVIPGNLGLFWGEMEGWRVDLGWTLQGLGEWAGRQKHETPLIWGKRKKPPVPE